MDNQLPVFVISLIISVVAGLLSFPSYKGIVGTLTKLLGSALFGLILGALVNNVVLLKQVQGHLSYQISENPYSNVVRVLDESSENSPLLERRRKKLKQISNDLEALEQGRVNLLSESQVIEAWLEGIRAARKEIRATNIVSPGTWLKNAEMAGPGDDTQRTAIGEREVSIRRIWIYDRTDQSAIDQIRAISERQLSYGISTRYITLDNALNQTFVTDYRTAIESIDVVIYDSNYVLATITAPTDRTIIGGYISINGETVSDAVQFYDRLWSISSETMPQ